MPPGAGAPLFTIGAPQAQPAATNARVSPGGAFVANVTLTLTDATQLQASEYELVQSGGAWQLTRRLDGFTQAVVDGSVVDGFQINLGAPPPAATDRFLLQPVTYAANSLTRAFDDPRSIAAASPVTATAAASNGGAAAIVGLAVVSPSVDPSQTATITFTSSSGAYDWELRDPRRQCVAQQRQRTRSPGQPMALNGFELQPSGVPGTGDASSQWRRPPFPPPATATRWRWWRCAMPCWSGVFPMAAASPAAWGLPTRGRRRWPTSACARKAPVTASSISTQVADSAKQALSNRTRQPRRGSRAADAVPAGLPGSSQGAAGGADLVRHLARRRLLTQPTPQQRDTMIRISTASAFDTGISTLQKRQGDLNEAQQQLTSGKRVSRLSDDPVAAARAERARADQARADADQRAVDASRAMVAQVESAFGDAGELVQQARELLVAAGNASYGPSSGAAARSSRLIRTQLLQVANRGDGGAATCSAAKGSARRRSSMHPAA